MTQKRFYGPHVDLTFNLKNSKFTKFQEKIKDTYFLELKGETNEPYRV